MTDAPLIEIEGLRVTFHGDDGRTTHAVDRVDLCEGFMQAGDGECGRSRGLFGSNWHRFTVLQEWPGGDRLRGRRF